MSSFELVRQTNTPTAMMRSWRELGPEEKKRRAVMAARDRDAQTLCGLLEAYTTLHGERGAKTSQHTLRMYRIGVQQMLEFASNERILSPSRDFGAALKAEFAARYAASSVNAKLAASRQLYAALRWAGATDVDPFLDVRGQPDPTPSWQKRAEYPVNDMEQMLELADPREAVLILLCGHAGLRIGEACGLEPSDVQGDFLQVRNGKGGKSGRVRMSKRLKLAIAQLPQVKHKGKNALKLLGIGSVRARELIIGLCGRAGVAYRAVHALRHTAGKRLYQQTRDVLAVRDHLRHSSIETSQGYAKRDDQSTSVVVDW
jgi:integrase